MKLDIPEILQALARERPIFHSEADFRLEISLRLHETCPDLCLIAEHPIHRTSKRAAYDLVLLQGRKKMMALELKYFSQTFRGEVNGEKFNLKWGTATDGGRHATLKDVQRMEEFLEKIQETENRVAQAAVIAITNDPLFWKGATKKDANDAEFDIREGRTVTGTLEWAAKAADKTKLAYGKIKLFGNYEMKWKNYSQVDGKFGQFRYLYIPVQPPKTVSG